MDVKKSIEDVVNKLKSDEGLKEQFLKDPKAALKKLTGIDLPADQLDGIISGVKAKLTADGVGDAVKGLGDLFKK